MFSTFSTLKKMKTNTGKQHERACLICSDNWQLFLYTVPFKPAAWNQKTKKCKSGFAMQTKEVTLRRDPRDSMQTQRRNSHISQHPHGSFGWVCRPVDRRFGPSCSVLVRFCLRLFAACHLSFNCPTIFSASTGSIQKAPQWKCLWSVSISKWLWC